MVFNTMNKSISIAILVAGVVLLILGFNASESLGSEISEMFTGTPTEQSIWLLILGIIGVIAGGFGLIRSKG